MIPLTGSILSTEIALIRIFDKRGIGVKLEFVGVLCMAEKVLCQITDFLKQYTGDYIYI